MAANEKKQVQKNVTKQTQEKQWTMQERKIKSRSKKERNAESG